MLNSILTHGVSTMWATTAMCSSVSVSPALPEEKPEPPTVNEAKVETLPYELTPERRALLDTIRFAEGTWANGNPVGYRIMFGGRTFSDLSRHPDRVNYSARYASAAAGAYQFMPFTWRSARKALKLNSFGPQEQDQAALWLVEKRGALPEIDRGRFSPKVAHRLSPEWASFPTLWGRSYYGQPVKSFPSLRSFFQTRLKHHGQESQPLTPVVNVKPVEPQKGPLFQEYFPACRKPSLTVFNPFHHYFPV